MPEAFPSGVTIPVAGGETTKGGNRSPEAGKGQGIRVDMDTMRDDLHEKPVNSLTRQQVRC